MTYTEKQKKDNEITQADLDGYDGVIDLKYLQYASGDSITLNGSKGKKDADSLDEFDDEDEYLEMYNDNNFSDESGDTMDFMGDNKHNPRRMSKKKDLYGGEFAAISEQPEEEYDDEDIERDLKQAYNPNPKKATDSGTVARKKRLKEVNLDEEENENYEDDETKKDKKKKKDKDKDKKKKKKKKKKKSSSDESEEYEETKSEIEARKKAAEDKLKRKIKKDEEKKFRIFEYDIQDHQMKFEERPKPKTLKKINLGHSLWLSAVLYIPEKDILVTGGYDDYKVKLWRLNKTTLDIKKLAEYRGHKGHITMLKYVPTKDFLVTGSQDCSFAVLSLKKIQCLKEGEEEPDELMHDLDRIEESVANIEDR